MWHYRYQFQNSGPFFFFVQCPDSENPQSLMDFLHTKNSSAVTVSQTAKFVLARMADSFGALINSHLIKAPRTALQSQAEREEGVLPVSWLESHCCPPSSLPVPGLKRHPSLHARISNGKVRTKPLEWWVSVSPGPRELLAWLELLSHRDALTLLLCSFTDHVSELGIRGWSGFVDLNFCEWKLLLPASMLWWCFYRDEKKRERYLFFAGIFLPQRWSPCLVTGLKPFRS